jgi:hypothetical protein
MTLARFNLMLLGVTGAPTQIRVRSCIFVTRFLYVSTPIGATPPHRISVKSHRISLADLQLICMLADLQLICMVD